MEQKPSIGRVVHYVSYGTPKGEYSSRCVAAIITDVKDDEDGEVVVRLKIFNTDGEFNSPWLKEKEVDKKEGGSWHWPERV